MSSLTSARFLAFSAFRAGSLVSLLFRPSSRSFSGAVAVARFGCPARAGAFARLWARRLGVAVAVRGCSVSVPVAVPSSRPAWLGRLVVCSGGLRGFLRSLSSAGVVGRA